MTERGSIEWLQQRLGYSPRDFSLFESALTHRSAAGQNNERLEFLGDSVLNLLVSERLYGRYPEATEGDLSRLRARVVSGPPLAAVAQGLGLGEMLRLGSGELKTGGFHRESILADALEALLGAVFLDGGLDAAREVVARLFDELIASAPDPAELKDSKTRLQEYLQARGLPLPSYGVLAVSGEPHAQAFRVGCTVEALQVRAEGEGSSRRRAEQAAAARALGEITATADR